MKGDWKWCCPWKLGICWRGLVLIFPAWLVIGICGWVIDSLLPVEKHKAGKCQLKYNSHWRRLWLRWQILLCVLRFFKQSKSRAWRKDMATRQMILPWDKLSPQASHNNEVKHSENQVSTTQTNILIRKGQKVYKVSSLLFTYVCQDISVYCLKHYCTLLTAMPTLIPACLVTYIGIRNTLLWRIT